MTAPNREAKVLQILLALDAASQNQDAMQSAIVLASQLQAELIGLLVEDIDLLRSSQLPFSSEVIAASGEERSLTSNHIEKSLRAWSKQMQAILTREAQKANIKVSFRSVKGRRIETLLSETSEYNLLIISHARQHLITPITRSDVVYLLFDGSSEAHHGVAIISEMALQGLKNIVLIDSCESGVEYGARKAAEWLTRHNVHVFIQKLQHEFAQTLPPLLKKYPAAFLLVPAHFPFNHQAEILQSLQKQLNCPVVMVR